MGVNRDRPAAFGETRALPRAVDDRVAQAAIGAARGKAACLLAMRRVFVSRKRRCCDWPPRPRKHELANIVSYLSGKLAAHGVEVIPL